MFNAFLEPCCPCGIGTNGNRVIAAVALPGTIPLASPKVTDYSIRRQPVARLSCGYQDDADHNAAVLLKGMSSEKHFSLPERQKYFPASSPLAIVPTLLL
jgi:hypothetical protein